MVSDAQKLIAECRERLAKATPGAWLIHNAWSDDAGCDCLHVDSGVEATIDDMKLITHAPTDLVALCDLCEKLSAENTEVRAKFIELTNAMMKYGYDKMTGNDFAAKLEKAEAEIERLKIVIEQHRGALGYPVRGDIPNDPEIMCGLCDAKYKELMYLSSHLGELEAKLAPL